MAKNKTPRFDFVIENLKKQLNEDALTPNLTGASGNPAATPVSPHNPNANKTVDPERTKTLLANYTKTAQAQKASNPAQANPNVAQTPVPGQEPIHVAPTNVDPNATVQPELSHDENKKALYDHLVNDLGLTDDAIADIFKK